MLMDGRRMDAGRRIPVYTISSPIGELKMIIMRGGETGPARSFPGEKLTSQFLPPPPSHTLPMIFLKRNYMEHFT